jgi:putative tryptophan/tyrosine transport system substrate-binding protein
MRRREFITGLGSMAAWPQTAHAQQQAIPVIGLLNQQTAETTASSVAAFHSGLGASGFVEGRNVAIEYRWAEGHNDRLGALAADLVRLRVAVIATRGDSPAFALKAATETIPIVCSFASDPVINGFVASLNHPAANFTGVYRFGSELEPKRLELLCEVIPQAAVIDLLVNPEGAITVVSSRELHEAARVLGRQIRTHTARNDSEIEAAFATLSQLHARALLIMGDSFFSSRSQQIGEMAARHAIPAIYTTREFAVGGGLMSYAPADTDATRLVGVYTGRILKGEKPAELPVLQSTKIEVVVNLKTAKALGLAVPQSILLRADEVIE